MIYSHDEVMGFAALYPSYYCCYFACSASAPKIRAQERMPLW
jgi:hypothetical protein